jgi:hypothetical protein
MWFLTKAKFTLGPHFMCLKGLHIVWNLIKVWGLNCQVLKLW